VRVAKEFAGRPETLHLARRFVTATLASWDLDDLSEVACLLSTELASNAVRHVGAMYEVVLEFDPPELCVEVLDPSPRLPLRPEKTADSSEGKGLFLVDALAARWGARLLSQGKAVWLVLSAAHNSPSLP
jgi:anti-sigma regulatory factor (Ser/Thr protein kinase)